MNEQEKKVVTMKDAYATGDFRQARRIGRELLATQLPDHLRKDVRKLMKATGIDPVIVAIFAITLAAIVTVAVTYWN